MKELIENWTSVGMHFLEEVCFNIRLVAYFEIKNDNGDYSNKRRTIKMAKPKVITTPKNNTTRVATMTYFGRNNNFICFTNNFCK